MAGDCEDNPLVRGSHCKFALPWMPDTVDVTEEDKLDLISGVKWFFLELRNDYWTHMMASLMAMFLGVIFVLRMILK